MGTKLHTSIIVLAAFFLVAVFCCVVLNATAETPPANRPVKDKWALVVGISKFQDSRINLKYPATDAKDFYNYLVTDGKFTKDHVILLTNEQATRSNILSVIGDKWLPRVANPDDVVVIYISTHGSAADADVGGVNYLIAHDTSIDELYATGIPIQDLMRTIKKRVHSDRVVMILDACHSGAASAEAKGLHRQANVDASVVAGTGQLVIASSKPNQISWEGKKYPNSVFTKHLIDSLKKHGSKTSLGEAFASLKDTVQQEVLLDRGQLQQPELKSQWKGDQLALSMPPSAPRPGIPLDTLQLSGSISVNKTDLKKLPQSTATNSASRVPPTPPVNLVLDNGNISIYTILAAHITPTFITSVAPWLGIITWMVALTLFAIFGKRHLRHVTTVLSSEIGLELQSPFSKHKLNWFEVVDLYLAGNLATGHNEYVLETKNGELFFLSKDLTDSDKLFQRIESSMPVKPPVFDVNYYLDDGFFDLPKIAAFAVLIAILFGAFRWILECWLQGINIPVDKFISGFAIPLLFAALPVAFWWYQSNKVAQLVRSEPLGLYVRTGTAKKLIPWNQISKVTSILWLNIVKTRGGGWYAIESPKKEPVTEKLLEHKQTLMLCAGERVNELTADRQDKSRP